MGTFLRRNAMGASAVGSAILVAVFASWTFGLSGRAIALWVGLPSVVGNFVANMKLKGNGNGT